jgi:hypothetical protein
VPSTAPKGLLLAVFQTITADRFGGAASAEFYLSFAVAGAAAHHSGRGHGHNLARHESQLHAKHLNIMLPHI